MTEPDRFSDKLLEVTRRFWQPYSSKRLNVEDALRICRNTAEFSRILQRWDQEPHASKDLKKENPE